MLKVENVTKYYGTFNIPDGEVATAPVKTSVNGYITYNTETTYNGVNFNNIRFEFEKGKIIKATANNTEDVPDLFHQSFFCKKSKYVPY